jgi:hypothetical protein
MDQARLVDTARKEAARTSAVAATTVTTILVQVMISDRSTVELAAKAARRARMTTYSHTPTKLTISQTDDKPQQ